MRTALLVLTLAALTVVSASGAAAAGGGPVTVLHGGKGVMAPDGETRYIALTTGRHTFLTIVRVRGGNVVRWRMLRGSFGVPLVAIDNTTDGASRDGGKLVLASPAGGTTTRFALIDTKTLRLTQIAFPGSWSFDAISPDAKTLFLVEYVGTGPNASYRVRAYDVAARRLLPTPIVDRTVGRKLMRGQAVTRATTRNGRWAYTLYARMKHEPFVHALDTKRRKALCIGLPVDMPKGEQIELRLRLRGARTLVVRGGEKSVAAVDTRTFVVHKH